jgi:DNA-binding YbaB/EbfC family protein
VAKGKSKKYRRTPAPSKPAGGAGLAQQIQQMQQEMVKTQEALADETVEVTAGGGMVTLVITGHQRVKSITLKPEVVDPDDVEMLQDLLVAAVNQAIEQSQTMAAERLEGITGGLNIPGLPGLM